MNRPLSFEEMKIFVELVESNGQNASYRKRLGLDSDEVRGHLNNLGFYRQVVGLVDKIKALFKNKKGNKEEIKQLRTELKLVIKGWKNV